MSKQNRKQELKDLKGLLIVSENMGARLNDTLALRKSNYDPLTGCLTFLCSKTGKWVTIPAFQETKDYINSLSPSTEPDPPLFKTLYRSFRENGGVVYNIIRDLFVDAGVRNETRPISHRFFRRRVAAIVGQENPLAAQNLLDHEHLSTTSIYMNARQKGVAEGVAILKKSAVVGKLPAPSADQNKTVPSSASDNAGAPIMQGLEGHSAATQDSNQQHGSTYTQNAS